MADAAFIHWHEQRDPIADRLLKLMQERDASYGSVPDYTKGMDLRRMTKKGPRV